MINEAIETDIAHDEDADLVEYVATSQLDVVDGFGHVRDDITEVEMASLPPSRRALLLELVRTAQQMKTAEEAVRVSSTDVASAVRDQATAGDALTEAMPRVTLQEAAEAASYAHRTGKSLPADPRVVRRINAAQAILELANAKFTAARQTAAATKHEAASARTAFFTALTAWTAATADGRPDQKDLVEAVRRTQGDRDAQAARQTSAKPASHLDALLGRGGRRGRAFEMGRNKSRAAI